MSQSREIVIVDGSEELLRAYQKYLQIANLKIIATFSKAKEALSYFGSNRAGLGDLIVLLDSRMSDMDSLEVARRLKEMNSEQKIILTTLGDPSRFRSEMKLFDAKIGKPFVISELLDAIEKVNPSVSAKGSWIFETQDVDKKYQELLSDSRERVLMCLSAEGVKRRLDVPGYIPYYVRARSKGLKVMLITEMTNENLFYCKELMINRGVELRHLDGVVMNFSVWDQRHTLEAVQTSDGSSILKRIFYSNLESIVRKNQFLFEQLWKLAVPGDQKIRELETTSLHHRIRVVSGQDEMIRTRMRIIHDAKVSLDICSAPELVTKIIIPRLWQEYANAIARGIRCRLMYEIPDNGMGACKDLIKLGFEVGHLQNLAGIFSLSERELLGATALKDPLPNAEPVAIYSDYPELVRQHQMVFDMLWSHATPSIERIREIEEKQKITNA
jgi:DNA-binding response OmpR family regulator